MFTVNINRRPYRVDFEHQEILDCPVTICVVANHRFTAVGKSVCNGINISKNLRRKIALKEALQRGKFDRDARVRFWSQYFVARGVTN